MNRAILLCVISACLVCLIVILLFASQIVGRHFNRTIALLFIAAMTALASAFATFIVEIRLASRTIRVRDEVLFHKEEVRESERER